jgi:hypothetical protein
MGFETWISQLKPGDASLTLFVFAFLGFLILKVWPWYTKEWWPAQQAFRKAQFEANQAKDDANQKTLDRLAEAIARMSVLVEQNFDATNTIIERLPASTIKRVRKDATQPRKPKAQKASAA